MMFKTRRVLLYLMLTLLLLGGVMKRVAGRSAPAGICDRMKPCKLLAQSDAERMLGQSARLMTDTSELKGDVRQCMCAYTGVSTDRAGGENGVLYFSLEERESNRSAEQARQVLVSTKEANAHDTSIWDLKGVGDEAFLLSNDSSSHLIMARRGPIIMRLQVKRAAGTKSLEELKTFAEKVSKHF